jgi:nucleoside-diphosphate-sugar epimerase
VINLGNPHETTILELAERIRAALGSGSTIQGTPYEQYYGAGFEDTRRRVPDITRAGEILDWRPEVALDEGLGRTIEWWKTAHP